MNWYFWSKKRTGTLRQWRWYRQWQLTSFLASFKSESWQCGAVLFCSLLNLRYSTLIVSLVFQCILIAYSHHSFIDTVEHCLVVIAVVRNLRNIYIVYFAIKCSTKRQNDKTDKVKTTTIYTLTEICLSNVWNMS